MSILSTLCIAAKLECFSQTYLKAPKPNRGITTPSFNVAVEAILSAIFTVLCLIAVILVPRTHLFPWSCSVMKSRRKGMENLQLVNPALRSTSNLNCHHVRANSLKSMLLILWTFFSFGGTPQNNLRTPICFRIIVLGSLGSKTYQILWKCLSAALLQVSFRAVLWRLFMHRCSFSSRCCMTSP